MRGRIIFFIALPLIFAEPVRTQTTLQYIAKENESEILIGIDSIQYNTKHPEVNNSVSLGATNYLTATGPEISHLEATDNPRQDDISNETFNKLTRDKYNTRSYSLPNRMASQSPQHVSAGNQVDQLTTQPNKRMYSASVGNLDFKSGNYSVDNSTEEYNSTHYDERSTKYFPYGITNYPLDDKSTQFTPTKYPMNARSTENWRENTTNYGNRRPQYYGTTSRTFNDRSTYRPYFTTTRGRAGYSSTNNVNPGTTGRPQYRTTGYQPGNRRGFYRTTERPFRRTTSFQYQRTSYQSDGRSPRYRSNDYQVTGRTTAEQQRGTTQYPTRGRRPYRTTEYSFHVKPSESTIYGNSDYAIRDRLRNYRTTDISLDKTSTERALHPTKRSYVNDVARQHKVTDDPDIPTSSDTSQYEEPQSQKADKDRTYRTKSNSFRPTTESQFYRRGLTEEDKYGTTDYPASRKSGEVSKYGTTYYPRNSRKKYDSTCEPTKAESREPIKYERTRYHKRDRRLHYGSTDDAVSETSNKAMNNDSFNYKYQGDLSTPYGDTREYITNDRKMTYSSHEDLPFDVGKHQSTKQQEFDSTPSSSSETHK